MSDKGREFEARLLAQVETVAAIGRAMLPKGRCDVDDLVQEVLLRAWAGRDSLRDPQLLPQWVAIIARNTAREWGRRSTPVYVDTLPETAVQTPTALEHLQSEERWEALLRALGALDEGDRRLLLERYSDDVSYADMQSEAGLSYAAVTTRVHRARERVRRLLVHTVGVILAVFVGQRQRAFGQEPRRTGGDSAMVTVIATVSALVIGGVGLGMYHELGAAAPQAPSLVVEARLLNPTPSAPSLAEILNDIRRVDEASHTYVATFSKRTVSPARGNPSAQEEVLHEGTVRRRGASMAADVTITRWTLEDDRRALQSEGRTEVTTDGELATLRWHQPGGAAATHITHANIGNVSEYDLLATWRPAGMSLADYLLDRSEDAAKDMTVENVTVDGRSALRIVVSMKSGLARSEFLIDPARGYRIVRSVKSHNDIRWETDVEPRHAGGDFWYPGRVTSTGYDTSSSDALLRRTTLEITSFIGGASIPDDTFASVPAKGNAFYDELRESANR